MSPDYAKFGFTAVGPRAGRRQRHDDNDNDNDNGTTTTTDSTGAAGSASTTGAAGSSGTSAFTAGTGYRIAPKASNGWRRRSTCRAARPRMGR